MKKRLILLIMLINLQLVNAQQEITLFGQSYSIVLLAPIFFMGIISLFFLGLIIKDNIGKIRLPKIDFSKLRKIYHENTQTIKELKPDHLTKFNILKNKSSKIGLEHSFNEFTEIAKEFFKDKFNIKQEFAFAELGNLVKGHLKDVNLANKLSTLKYSGVAVNSPQIKELFKEFEDLLKEYKVKEEKQELRLFARIKQNLLNIFKNKETKQLSIKEKIIYVKPAIKEPKLSILPKLFGYLLRFKKKELKTEIKNVELKQIKKEEIIKQPEITKPAKRYRFILFDKILKFRILHLIKKGRNILLINPLLAKKYYARALLAYYRLPIQEEKEIANNLMQFHNELLTRRSNEKLFLDISKNLIDIKHKGKHISKKSIGLLNTLKNFIEREELLAIVKLKEFSHKLKNEERKLSHFIKKERGLLREDKFKFKHFLKKEENIIGDVFKQDIKKFGTVISNLKIRDEKGVSKEKLSKKTITLVDKYNSRLEFIYKQPRIIVAKEETKKEPLKKETKQIRLLQKQRNELYNKLLDLEDGKLTHDKLN